MQSPAQLLPPAEIGTAQQEIPVDKAAASFTQEEFDLLEFAVFTAYRQQYHEGASKQHLDELYNLRLKLMNHVSEEHYYAII